MTRPAIIVAHGQPSDPDPQQSAIMTLAGRVAAHTRRQVTGVTLAKPEALAQAVAHAPDAMVYPMFMANGWFTSAELPRRLRQCGGQACPILQPFGTDPTLAGLCIAKIRDAAEDAGWPISGVTLLLIAHGSQRARGSAIGTEAMATELRPYFGRVITAFIEEAPFLADTAKDLGPRAIALPFFATHAGHTTDDIPDALSASGFSGPCLPPIGLVPEVPALIAAALDRGNAEIALAARDA
ncbi:MAG: CbiX/SirB N-terminal domain-containing protein [Paracoccus sp. (in: a-proteobacteria)]